MYVRAINISMAKNTSVFTRLRTKKNPAKKKRRYTKYEIVGYAWKKEGDSVKFFTSGHITSKGLEVLNRVSKATKGEDVKFFLLPNPNRKKMEGRPPYVVFCPYWAEAK